MTNHKFYFDVRKGDKGQTASQIVSDIGNDTSREAKTLTGYLSDLKKSKKYIFRKFFFLKLDNADT